jgi:hypothetical protein
MASEPGGDPTMASFMLKDGRLCRLRLCTDGPHRFGGVPVHRGVTPANTDTPLQTILLLDLADGNCPIKSDGTTRYLPLYYPLKYGAPAVQYAVLSDDEIKILYMSDEVPAAEERKNVRVQQFPASSAEILPLRYEEARILEFVGGYFQPNANDSAILRELEHDHPIILIGGYRRLPVNAGDVICRNLECQFFNRRLWLDVVASIPPVPINGADDFWYEYKGANMELYFGLCRYCKTIIAFNVAS